MIIFTSETYNILWKIIITRNIQVKDVKRGGGGRGRGDGGDDDEVGESWQKRMGWWVGDQVVCLLGVSSDAVETKMIKNDEKW